MKLDRVDLRMLARLQESGRVTNAELSQAVGLSPAPCHRRLRELESEGVIDRYVALLDMESVGLRVNAFVSVQIETSGMNRLTPFEDAVGRLPEVIECYALSGDWDYLLHVVVPDLEAFERFLRLHLAMAPGIGRIRSAFALRNVKRSTALPLLHLTSRT